VHCQYDDRLVQDAEIQGVGELPQNGSASFSPDGWKRSGSSAIREMVSRTVLANFRPKSGLP
jgi:hypothetical protein